MDSINESKTFDNMYNIKDMKYYWELLKPRLGYLVVTTTFLGIYLSGTVDIANTFFTILGTFILSGGSATINQYLEWEVDSRMPRTKNRPIPSGKVTPRSALYFGIILILLGLLVLFFMVNTLTMVIGLASSFIYIAMYTPLKYKTALNTPIGAISGAIPPVMGLTSVTNKLDLQALFLFLILFFWQHPHFFALSWKYKDQYINGGFKMLSGKDNSGKISGFFMTITCIALLISTTVFKWVGFLGNIYLITSTLLGTYFLYSCLKFWRLPSEKNARKTFITSLIYFPLLLLFMFIDRV